MATKLSGKRKRKRINKKEEERQLAHFLDWEVDELPIALRAKYDSNSKNDDDKLNQSDFEIMSVEYHHANHNQLHIPEPKQSVQKTAPKNTSFPGRKKWK